MKRLNRFSDKIDSLDVLNELSEDEFPVRYKKFYIDYSKEDESYNVYTKMEWESADVDRVPEAELPDVDSLKEFIMSIEDVSDFDDEELECYMPKAEEDDEDLELDVELDEKVDNSSTIYYHISGANYVDVANSADGRQTSKPYAGPFKNQRDAEEYIKKHNSHSGHSPYRITVGKYPDAKTIYADNGSTDTQEEATNVGSIGQHKRCSIDLIPNVQEEDQEEELVIKEAVEDRGAENINTYVYVSDIRKAIENKSWDKEEYPLFEEQAEYLKDWLKSAGFEESEYANETSYISSDDKFYVTISNDGKFIRFTDTDKAMEESPNITELEPNIPEDNKEEVPQDDEVAELPDKEPTDGEEDTIDDVEIPDDAPEEILLEVDVPEEETGEDTPESPSTSFSSHRLQPKKDQDTEGGLSEDENQLLSDLGNCVESETGLEDMEYFILKYNDKELVKELVPILYKAMNDGTDPQKVFDEMSQKISEYAESNGYTEEVLPEDDTEHQEEENAAETK